MSFSNEAVSLRGKRKRIHVNRARLRRNRITGWLFISPWFIGFLAFALFPFLASLYYSFTNYDIISSPQWIGLQNYSKLMHDPLFWHSLYNTLYYTVFSVPLSTIVALCIALLLNMNIRGLTIYRTVFYLPAIVPFVASSVLWLWLFNPSFGFIDALLRAVGLPAPGWLYSVHWVKPSFILMSLWGVGQTVVIYLAGLQGVSKELYEAAIIEGANAWQRSIKITIPMISPVILFNVIMGLIGSFQFFTQAYVMTQGGPDNASMFFALYLYQQAFQFLHLGYASAMAWLLFVLILVVTVLVYRGSSRWVYYGSEQ
ncbi:carbohydrate ABC transporter permease [Alicyclobacillus fastidiosus]|uniref:Sugar ABC transporter permease n=1 Tax=Alicyclobacillus fastidiosus TaxID=392011 RepID=A0ABV5AEE1_9BACL|nr:sugar ABC transporter permease [Alicyclobacillus fastidiosus]WEH09804.1 sugar ABC transporter permease [Alicyclobacillus fastidiosus]